MHRKMFGLAALALPLLMGPATATEIVFTQTGEPAGCTITIRLGGYCCNIDVPEKVKIHDYVTRSTVIDSATEYSLTFDGQSTLCLKIDDPRAADQIYQDLIGLVPADASRSIMLGQNRAAPVRGQTPPQTAPYSAGSEDD